MRTRPIPACSGSRCPGRSPAGAPQPTLAIVVFLVSGLAAAGCSPIPPHPEWTVDLVEEVRLGADPVTEETAFHDPTDIGVDAAGNVYVLDSGNHRIQVFDADGNYLRSLGSAGQGPGQLASPTGLWVYPSGEVLVADTNNRRIQRFGAAGDALDSFAVDVVPLDLVGVAGRIWLLRLPAASLVLGPEATALVHELGRQGEPLEVHVDPVPASAGILYMLRNTLRIAPRPGGGFAVAETHVVSRIRVYSKDGALERETPVLYKADAWAPLGRLPELVNEESLGRVARTASDLAWDARRGMYWLLAGYVDRTPEGEWVVGQEIYRYDESGEYRGSVVLPSPTRRLAASPDGRIWTIDAEGVVHSFRVADPERAPSTPDAAGFASDSAGALPDGF